MLDALQIRAIREQAANGARNRDLAERYGVSRGRISQIVAGAGQRARAQRDKGIVAAVAGVDGESVIHVAKRHGLTRAAVYSILGRAGK